VEREHQFVLLEQAQTALELHDVGVGVDDVFEPVGLAVFVRLAGAQGLVEQFDLVAQ